MALEWERKQVCPASSKNGAPFFSSTLSEQSVISLSERDIYERDLERLSREIKAQSKIQSEFSDEVAISCDRRSYLLCKLIICCLEKVPIQIQADDDSAFIKTVLNGVIFKTKNCGKFCCSRCAGESRV